jgi:hypothetical protein
MRLKKFILTYTGTNVLDKVNNLTTFEAAKKLRKHKYFSAFARFTSKIPWIARRDPSPPLRAQNLKERKIQHKIAGDRLASDSGALYLEIVCNSELRWTGQHDFRRDVMLVE